MSSVGTRRSSQADNSGSPSPVKRFKRTETIPDNADAATRAANALDLDSDGVLDLFKCPTCRRVPLGEVLQCPDGHPICLECQLESRGVACTQCSKDIKMANGDWIKCKLLEQLLDFHWFLCPFRKNGCQEVLSRGDVLRHKEDCTFDGNRVRICEYFDDTADVFCPFWVSISEPEEALEHLKSHAHVNFLTEIDEDKNEWWWLPVNRRPDPVIVSGAVKRQNGGIFLIVCWIDKKAKTLSFAGLRMDLPKSEEEQPTNVKLTFESQQQNSKMPKLSLILPIVSVLDAKLVMDPKPVQVSRTFLQKHFLDNNEESDAPYNTLKVDIHIS